MFCLSCFAKGAETVKHKNNHAYSIRSDDFVLFKDSNWSAREEKIFLSLIYSYGIGNWVEISSLMHQRTSEECRAHFYRHYFDGPFGSALGLTNENAYVRHDVPYILKAHTMEPPRASDLNSFICKNMSGYRFARSEFEIPYDKSAESILNNLSLEVEDVYEKDQQMQIIASEVNCAMFRAYNHRLKERKRRYRVMSDHGLIMQRKTLAWLSMYSEVFHRQSSVGKFAAFMQISDPTSFDFLLESMKLFLDTKRHLYR